ncbi:hypothetical protein KY289_026566 [Solanum tuberosum]|nr:hypothetical protein KY289_026566 [Solanum tuberosum]
MRKVKEEKLKVCPECNTDLGAAPLQKIRPDHQVQGIRDMVSSKRGEFIERGLIEKLKKGKPKKLASEDIDLNKIPDMLIDTSPSPAPVIVATSSRRKEKSISSIVNATPLVDDDQVSNQHSISSSSTVRGRGRGRGRGSSENNANVYRFQDPSRFNDVVDLNKGDTHPGSLTSPLLSVNTIQHNQQIKGDQPGSSSAPLLSGKATQLKQQVESIAYDDESSKNDSISKKNKSIEPLDGMNDLSQAREKVPKDVNKPSSYIMKYLAHKLSLQSEDEVKLHMLGMLICPDFRIEHLEKLWLRVAPHSGKSSAKVGASAEEFVMILKYSRSHPKLN